MAYTPFQNQGDFGFGGSSGGSSSNVMQSADVRRAMGFEYTPAGTGPASPNGIQGTALQQLAGSQQQDPSGGFKSKLEEMMNGKFSPDDPSYQWRFNQGEQAVERSAASRGLLGSGNAAIELQQYGQGAASTEYGAQFQRVLQGLGAEESAFSSGYARLAELAGMSTGMKGIQTSGSTAQNALQFQKQQAGQRQENANNSDAAFMQMLQGGLMGQVSPQNNPQPQPDSFNYSSTNSYPGGTAPIDQMSGYSSQSPAWGSITIGEGATIAAWGGE